MALAGMFTLLLRVPFLTTPLGVDEGGYATIVSQWAAGARLYHDVWVDRPQGPMVFYRLVFAVLGPHAWAVRAVIALWAAIGVVAVADVARALRGSRAAALAAMVFAVLSATPRAEGFAANGELLAVVPSVGCVALLLRASPLLPGGRRRAIPISSPWLLLAAGISGATAVLMKQSGFDGAVAVVTLLVVAGVRRWGRGADVVRALGLLAAGAAVVVLPTVLHGMSLGLGDWWFAVVGQRSGSESLWSGDLGLRAERFGRFATILGPVLVAVVVVLAAGPAARLGTGLVHWTRRSGRGSAARNSATRNSAAPVNQTAPAVAAAGDRVLIAAWAVASLAGFAFGGLFHPHYVIGLAAVMAVLAGCSLDAAWTRAVPVAATAGAVAVTLCLVSAWPSMTARDPDVRSLRSTADVRVVSVDEVAAYIRAHTTETDSIYAMYANAGLYFAAERRPASPYLWWLTVAQVPAAVEDLARVFNGPDAPRYVARYGEADAMPGSEAIVAAFERRYRLETVVAGVPLYRLMEDGASSGASSSQ
ncbi:MAG: hypothetical protein ACKV2O_01635 [Acidimicrobiales bacterium]